MHGVYENFNNISDHFERHRKNFKCNCEGVVMMDFYFV